MRLMLLAVQAEFLHQQTFLHELGFLRVVVDVLALRALKAN
jgi:hypothetical protein